MIRIAQAASSEYFGKYGTPPNQRRTGATAENPGGNMDGELNVVPFATNGWTAVFRAKEERIAERIAWIMVRAVANGDHIGYGQASLASDGGKYPRTGVFDALHRISTADPTEIKTLCNCDCSSLVGAAVYFSGVYEPKLRDMWTGSEREILMGTGQFIELDDQELLQSAKGIKRGDILWKPGHTAVSLDSDETLTFIPARTANCKACNFRKGPGTEYEVIKELPCGVLLDYVSSASNGWAQVRLKGVFGYVSPKYYEILPTMTATYDLWLRKEAGVIKQETEILVIPAGAKAYVTGNTKKVGLTTWYEAIYLNKKGWASGKYLR